MVNTKNPALVASDIPRRRGRPAGKNRVPLSQEERRARNAQYERERRIENAEAMSQLIEAVQCDPDISNADLLATVISRIQRASGKSDVNDLERINANLESQIANLKQQLGLDDEALALLDADDTNIETDETNSSSHSRGKYQHRDVDNLEKKRKKRKRSNQLTSDSKQPEKKLKTESETIIATHSDSETIPPMESQTHSLLEVPSIVAPPQLPADQLADPENVDLPSDFLDMSLDILTDSEKRLLSDWAATYSGDDQLAGY